MIAEDAPQDDSAAVEECQRSLDRLREELCNVIVGQEKLIEHVLIAVLAQGHLLADGGPGLAKTLLMKSLSKATGLKFARVGCTRDLLPNDLPKAPRAGETGDRPVPGLPSANLILLDEIDLTPPKTQVVLLDAMSQQHMTPWGELPGNSEPLFVLATRNPFAGETFGLSSSALDRFMLHVTLDYPEGGDEWEIARRATTGMPSKIQPLMKGQDVRRFQELVSRIPVSDRVLEYAWRLVRASRPLSAESPEFVDRWVAWGSGPRGLLALVAGAKARAIVRGRRDPQPRDVSALAPSTLRHRISPNQAALASALNSEAIVGMLLEAVPQDQSHHGPESRGK